MSKKTPKYVCPKCGELTRVFLNGEDAQIGTGVFKVFWGIGSEGKPALFGVNGTPYGMSTHTAMVRAYRFLEKNEWKHPKMYHKSCGSLAELV